MLRRHIQIPFGREEGRGHGGRGGAVVLLDPGAVGDAGDFRVGDPGVFGDLAEQVLAVDRLEPPAEQAGEVQPARGELLLLACRDPVDDLLGGKPPGVGEALRDAVQGAGTPRRRSSPRRSRAASSSSGRWRTGRRGSGPARGTRGASGRPSRGPGPDAAGPAPLSSTMPPRRSRWFECLRAW